MDSKEFLKLEVGDIFREQYCSEFFIFRKDKYEISAVNRAGETRSIELEDLDSEEVYNLSKQETVIPIEDLLAGIRNKIEDLEDVSNILKGL